MLVIPPEVSVLIFHRLTYPALLAATTVCHAWRITILEDVGLRKQLFQIRNDSYLDDGHPVEDGIRDDSGSIRFHPAISKIRYRIGDVYDEVQLPSISIAFRALHEFEVVNDFVSIPVVEEICILVTRTLPSSVTRHLPYSLSLVVKNIEGVRIGDVFSELVTESRKLRDLVALTSHGFFFQRVHSGQSPALSTKAELLGEQRYFSGFSEACRTGKTVSVTVVPTTK